jgi:hypothetical protein
LKLDLDLITWETAANFAAVNYLPTAEFAKLPEGSKKVINGKNYHLKDSRWRSAETGDLLESKSEIAERLEEEADQEEADRQYEKDEQDLIDDLNTRQPYSVSRSGDAVTVDRKPSLFDTGSFKFETSGGSLLIEGRNVLIGEGLINFYGAADDIKIPAQSYAVGEQPSALPRNPSQYEIHRWLHNAENGVLRKAGGGFAEFKGANKDAGREKPKCKSTSHSCGYSCISGKKTCRITMTLEQQRAAKALKKELRAFEKNSSEPKKQNGRSLKITAKLNDLDQKISLFHAREKALKDKTREVLAIARSKGEDIEQFQARKDQLWAERTELSYALDRPKEDALLAAKDLRTELKKIDSAAAKAIVLAANLTYSKDFTGQPMADRSIRQTQRDLAEIVQLTGGIPPTLKDVVMGKGRAYASPAGLLVYRQSANSTLYHEFAHHIEFSDNGLLSAAKDWRNRKAGNGKLQRLSDLTQNKGYGDDEVALADSYLIEYVGKVYPDQAATEVVSVGLEHFSTAEGMLRLRSEAKDHFDFVLEKVLKV